MTAKLIFEAKGPKPSAKEIRKYTRAYNLRQIFKRKFFLSALKLGSFFLIITGLMLFILNGFQVPFLDGLDILLWVFASFLYGCILLAGIMLISLPYWSARQHVQNRFLDDTLLYQWDVSGIAIKTIYNEYRYLWDELLKIEEFSDFFVLVPTKANIVVLPKRVFNQQKIDNLHTFAARTNK